MQQIHPVFLLWVRLWARSWSNSDEPVSRPYSQEAYILIGKAIDLITEISTPLSPIPWLRIMGSNSDFLSFPSLC